MLSNKQRKILGWVLVLIPTVPAVVFLAVAAPLFTLVVTGILCAVCGIQILENTK